MQESVVVVDIKCSDTILLCRADVVLASINTVLAGGIFMDTLRCDHLYGHADSIEIQVQ